VNNMQRVAFRILGAVVVAAAVMSGPRVGAAQTPAIPAEQPTARTDPNSQRAHEELLAKAKRGRIDVYFVGDSITRRWGATDYPQLLENWTKNFFGWNAADFGWGGDTTQNILWRLQNGELDAVQPKVVVILAGTNNLPATAGDDDAKAADISRGIAAIVDTIHMKASSAIVILTAVFPRNDRPGFNGAIDKINTHLARLADGVRVRFVNVNDRLADASGQPLKEMLGDGLHPTVKGYQMWADALKPILTRLLGAPAAQDLAPPATGDPSRR
jgi:lysophospholipase L1-like esterase